MAGRIPAIKLDLVWWNDDPSADRNMVAMQFGVVAVVGDDGYGLAVWSGPDLVSPVGIGLAAAAHRRIVRLHQAFEPSADGEIVIAPLPTPVWSPKPLTLAASV